MHSSRTAFPFSLGNVELHHVLVAGTMADEVPITLFTALEFLKQTFDKYAQEDAEKGTLGKKELGELLRDRANAISKTSYTYTTLLFKRFINASYIVFCFVFFLLITLFDWRLPGVTLFCQPGSRWRLLLNYF